MHQDAESQYLAPRHTPPAYTGLRSTRTSSLASTGTPGLGSARTPSSGTYLCSFWLQ